MNTRLRTLHAGLGACALVVGLYGPASPAFAAKDDRAAAAARHAAVVAHWTAERRAAAIPRDLRIDSRGLAYLRRPDGQLTPYGHRIEAEGAGVPTPRAKPGGGGDSDGPAVSNMNPGGGATIGANYTFSAKVSDPSGVRSVSFVVVYPNGIQTQSFSASPESNDLWSVSLQGFSDGDWSWYVVAKDNAGRGGNTTTTDPVGFTVDTSGGGEPPPPPPTGTVTNGHWSGGTVQTAAGRILFEMPSNKRLTRWTAYVCSGTVATDETAGRSVIITAAHCVYDDANKAFARNVMFIPDQDHSSAKTDWNCANDPIGCWTPNFGVVDVEWTNRTFPDNVKWDYAFYVVKDSGEHQPGKTTSSDVLDSAAKSLAPQFASPSQGAVSHALGYSYSDDPNFMYCAEPMYLAPGSTVNWWLSQCGLSGGASGGPWMQPVSGGDGPIISVNSWGYTNSPGMAGPRLDNTSAGSVFNCAKDANFANVPTQSGQAGVVWSTISSCP